MLDKAAHEGGVAAHVAGLSIGLAERGWQVETLRLHGRGEAPPPSAPGDRHRLPLSYGAIEGWRRRGGLANVLQDAQPDLVHLHGAFTRLSSVLLAMMRRRLPVVATLHDTRPFCFLMTRRFGPSSEPCARRCGFGCFTSGCVGVRGPVQAARWFRRWRVDTSALSQWQRLPQVIAPSRYIADLAEQHGFAPQRLRVVPHGVAIPAPAQREEVACEEPGVLFVGSLVQAKGPLVLLDALDRLRALPWRAALAGSGPLQGMLEQRIRSLELGERVTLLGQVDQRQVLDGLLAGARVVVMPSLVAESVGLAGLEALASGTPVVSFGQGGVMEWLRPGENGAVAVRCDASALADAVRPLLIDPALAARWGSNGRSMVRERFNLSRQCEQTIAVYEDAMRCRRSGVDS